MVAMSSLLTRKMDGRGVGACLEDKPVAPAAPSPRRGDRPGGVADRSNLHLHDDELCVETDICRAPRKVARGGKYIELRRTASRIDGIFASSLDVDFTESAEDNLYNSVLLRKSSSQGFGATVAFGDDVENAGMPTAYLNQHDNIELQDDPPGKPSAHWWTFDWRLFQSNAPQTWSNNIYVGNTSGQNEHAYFVAPGAPGFGCTNACTARQTDALPSDELVYPDRVAAGITKQFPNFPSTWGCGTVGNMAIP
jgi:hypothetical protein